MTIAQDNLRKFKLIAALHYIKNPDLRAICKATGIPAPSAKRQLAALRDDFAMVILFTRSTGSSRGAVGTYAISDWGIICQHAFCSRFQPGDLLVEYNE